MFCECGHTIVIPSSEVKFRCDKCGREYERVAPRWEVKKVSCFKCVEEGKGLGTLDKGQAFVRGHRIYCENHKPEGAISLMVIKRKRKVDVTPSGNTLQLDKSIVEDAERIFNEIKDEKGFKGSSEVLKKAGALYVAIKRSPLCPPIHIKNIALATNIDRRSIAKIYRKIMLKLEEQPQLCTLRPNIYVDLLLKKLEADEGLTQRASLILEKVLEDRLHLGRHPAVVAGAIVYAACMSEGRSHIQRDIAKMCGITEASIRSVYQKIKKFQFYTSPIEI